MRRYCEEIKFLELFISKNEKEEKYCPINTGTQSLDTELPTRR
jgi:hypothetical protein